MTHKNDLELKSNSLTRSALHLVQKNELLDNLREHLKKIKKSPTEDIPRKVKKLIKTFQLLRKHFKFTRNSSRT